MSKKQRKFVDDGWAVWIDGEDTSTIHINNWLNPKGKSYIDIAIHIRGIRSCKSLNVYVPFPVLNEEIEDVSLSFGDTKILQAIFSAACIVDYKKNPHTSEIAYNGKTVDIVHISATSFKAEPLSSGTLIRVDLQELQQYLDNDEAYFIWHMPHKSLDAIFKPYVDVGNAMERMRDLLTTPVVSEKYGYSIRINESRLLPEEITRIGLFHRQKLKKADITISIDEDYEINDVGCYRIRRLEENLYAAYLPSDYRTEDVITYQWVEERDKNMKAHYNFYFDIVHSKISQNSVLLYVLIMLLTAVAGNAIYGLIRNIIMLLW